MGVGLHQALPASTIGRNRAGVRVHVIVDYATSWLAEHREMPTGIHQAKTSKPHPMGFRDLPTMTVDFTNSSWTPRCASPLNRSKSKPSKWP